MIRTGPYHLLIADDDQAFREVLKSVFAPWFALHEAASGEQALEIVARTRVDLIVLDMYMETLTGLETIRLVKRLDQRLPCILVTADATEELRAEAQAASVWSVLAKPVRRGDLLKEVSTALDSTWGRPDVFSRAGLMN